MTAAPSHSLSQAQSNLAEVRSEISKIIYGQDGVIDQTLITLLAGGHALLVGVPGLAKTLLVDTVSTVLGLQSSRVQCTPDLMPSDIIGSEVLEQDESGKRSFRFIEGPVFAQFLMADEINRASPRTQSALLQAMQEKRVTVNGSPRDLPTPFHVLATQNPIEQEGTYPMPEAQLDRFLMQIDVTYPALDAERKMLVVTTSSDKRKPAKILNAAKLIELQTLVRDIPVGDQVVDAILTLVRRGRPDNETSSAEVKEFVTWAPGPRAAQALMLASKAKALLEGRSAPSVDDVLALSAPVLRHRMALTYKARTAGLTLDGLIAKLGEGL